MDRSSPSLFIIEGEPAKGILFLFPGRDMPSEYRICQQRSGNTLYRLLFAAANSNFRI